MTTQTVTSHQRTGSHTRPHDVVELNNTNFAETLNEYSVVLVDFWAPWCGPCRSFAPVYETVAKKHPEIVFAKVNIDDEQVLAAKNQIRAIPTLMAFRDGNIVFSQAGALPASRLEEVIAHAVGR